MNSCPDKTELERFYREELDASANDALMEHIEECVHCQRFLDDFTESFGGPVGDVSIGDVPVIPGYKIITPEIGRGGMGVVYRAQHDNLRRQLAVKVMRTEYRHADSHQKRFVAEAQVMAQLQHPGIPAIYEIGELIEGSPFIAMKLVNGGTFSDMLQQRQSPGDELARHLAIFEQACQAVAYAHSKGVVHRDLKPSNVMVGAFGEVHVMDWGLAKVLKPTSNQPQDESQWQGDIGTIVNDMSTWKSRGVLGTLAYAPPEQAQGKTEDTDCRSDVFSLGAMLCEILTEKPPYASDDQSELERIVQDADLAPAFARLDASDADRELIELAKRCLAKERENRPAEAGVVARFVGDYLNAVEEKRKQAEMERRAAEVKAEEEGKRRKVEQQRAEAEKARGDAERKRREMEQAKAREERKRRKFAWALAATVLVLIAGTSAALLWYFNEQSRQQTLRAVERATENTKLAQSENDIRRELELANNYHNILIARLRKRGEILRMLDNPDGWQRQIDLAKAAWERAKTIQNNAVRSVAQQLVVRLKKMKSLLDQDQEDIRCCSAY